MKESNSIISIIIKVVLFVVFVGMVIIGQKTISGFSLCIQLIGLIGLIVLLFLYNRKYQ